MSTNIFERLCLRFKAGDEVASMKEPAMDNATVHEAGETPPAVIAPHPAVAQDSSSRTEEKICISTSMS